MVSDENFFLFSPLLHEVAMGGIETRHVAYPIRRLPCPDRFPFTQAPLENNHPHAMALGRHEDPVTTFLEIPYILSDAESDTLTIIGEYSLDQGQSWLCLPLLMLYQRSQLLNMPIHWSGTYLAMLVSSGFLAFSFASPPMILIPAP